MARRSPPRKVTYFEPVPPRLARKSGSGYNSPEAPFAAIRAMAAVIAMRNTDIVSLTLGGREC